MARRRSLSTITTKVNSNPLLADNPLKKLKLTLLKVHRGKVEMKMGL